MPRLVHFEIEVENPERAADFYRNVLGWEIKKWDGPMEYYMVMTGPKDEPGIDGGMYTRQKPLGEGGVTNAFICTIEVDSVDDYVVKVEANGGCVKDPKKAIPGVGWYVNCLDTEGNIFGLMHGDPNAA